jgi:hypothetical protein
LTLRVKILERQSLGGSCTLIQNVGGHLRHLGFRYLRLFDFQQHCRQGCRKTNSGIECLPCLHTLFFPVSLKQFLLEYPLAALRIIRSVDQVQQITYRNAPSHKEETSCKFMYVRKCIYVDCSKLLGEQGI